MAQIVVAAGKAVQYDGHMLYGAGTYTVNDTYENYKQAVLDLAASNISSGPLTFTNNINIGEQYLAVEVDLSKAAWNTVGTHMLFDVTGLVKVKILAECTADGDDTTGNTSTIQLGFRGTTNALIAATQVDDLVARELWYDATPTTTYDTPANAILERVTCTSDIGYEIAGEAAVAGKIKFHCWWTPLNSVGAVVAGTGAEMA